MEMYCFLLLLNADKLFFGNSLAAFMIFWNYRLCVITSPGSVPEGWVSYLHADNGNRLAQGIDTNDGLGRSRGQISVRWMVWKLRRAHIRRDTARIARITNRQEVGALFINAARADPEGIAHHCRQCKTCWVSLLKRKDRI